ncbi:MAG: SMC-Scp complex subunit ScpB [Spirochaetales bacterium]|nr:SMC-Scp complex subunit ScpB [Leptospiraceae bacterium]MCP5482747.1 SMC-Scp complex subunit ScpB [Spirochaetales bacterium]MCP5485241.1 SMC-Scp complex subunit ScpB [Spirochaetales bacterium]
MSKKETSDSDSQQEDGTSAPIVHLPVSEATEAGLPEPRELDHDEIHYYRGLVECILFLSTEPVALSALARRCQLDRANTRMLVDSLIDDHAERDGGFLLREIAGGYQFTTSERYSQAMKELFKEQKRETLSRSTLETLAIICYRQPITLPEIDEVRGVNSRAMVTTLLQKKLVKPQGYRPVPGRPTLYVTTRNFLTHFALNSLADLPPLEDIKELKFDDLD